MSTIPMTMTGVPISPGTKIDMSDVRTVFSDVLIGSRDDSAPPAWGAQRVLTVIPIPGSSRQFQSVLSCKQHNQMSKSWMCCAKKCQCLKKLDDIVCVVSPSDTDMFNNVNHVASLSSERQTCNYCGQVQSVDRTCLVCYDDYCMECGDW